MNDFNDKNYNTLCNAMDDYKWLDLQERIISVQSDSVQK